MGVATIWCERVTIPGRHEKRGVRVHVLAPQLDGANNVISVDSVSQSKVINLQPATAAVALFDAIEHADRIAIEIDNEAMRLDVSIPKMQWAAVEDSQPRPTSADLPLGEQDGL